MHIGEPTHVGSHSPTSLRISAGEEQKPFTVIQMINYAVIMFCAIFQVGGTV